MMSKELSKFIEPTAILSLVIGVTYIMGWFHTESYFSRFGVQPESLNLPATYYLSSAIYIGLFTVFLYMVLSTDYCKSKLNIKQYMHYNQMTIYIILGIFMLALVASGYFGMVNARDMIEGDHDPTFLINFSWKEDTPKEIEGKELILIIYNDHKYYVVAKQKPAPNYPETYIIPDDQIEFASTKKNINSQSFIDNLLTI